MYHQAYRDGYNGRTPDYQDGAEVILYNLGEAQRKRDDAKRRIENEQLAQLAAEGERQLLGHWYLQRFCVQ